MAASAEEIHALYKSRETRLAARFQRMRAVSAVYNGEVDLPLPSWASAEIDQAAVPNLCEQGTDQLARRVASVIPNLDWPSTHPGFAEPDDRADMRRRANYGWWERNDFRSQIAQRARWYISYASAPVVIRPDKQLINGGGPRWDMVHPFDMYPGPRALGQFTPTDVIIRHKRTLSWLKERYPEAMGKVKVGAKPAPDTEFTVLEHITEYYVCMVVCGIETDPYTQGYGTSPAEKLFEVYNPTGRCWAVIPDRKALDAPKGQFDNIMGMYATQAALMALHVHATVKAIWPTPVLQNPNGMAIPQVVQRYDPETGEPMIVTNGILSYQNLDPSYRSLEVMDRIESSQRQTAALPPELGGTGGQNVRTGRRGSQVMAASLDFTIAEAQDDMAKSLREECVRAAEIDKYCFNESKSFHVSWKNARGRIRYKPSDIWEDGAEPIVEYPIAGSDLNDLVINGGQRIGQGTLSPQSFMEIDPLVKDVESEMQRIRFSGIEQAFFTSLQTMASQPEGPWQVPDLIRFARKMIGEGKEWFVAAAELQQEKQEEQAQGAPQGAPETMPGLAMPGQGAEVPSTVPGLGPGSEDVTALLSQLGVADMAFKAR